MGNKKEMIHINDLVCKALELNKGNFLVIVPPKGHEFSFDPKLDLEKYLLNKQVVYYFGNGAQVEGDYVLDLNKTEILY